MKNLFTLFLAILTSTVSGSASAGAWLQEDGRGQIITTTRFYGTAEYFDEDGHRGDIPLFTKTDIAPYFEYGVSDKFTLGGEIDFAAATSDGEEFGNSFDAQFSYGHIFGRAYLYKADSFVVSIEPGITFPARIDPDLAPDGSQPIPEIKLNFGYGYNRWEQNNFVDASVKYRKRSGDLNDMSKFELTIGHHITEYFIGIAQISHEQTLGSVEKTGNYNLTRPQLSVLHDEREHFAQLFGIFTSIYGRNTGAGYGAIYSVWYRF